MILICVNYCQLSRLLPLFLIFLSAPMIVCVCNNVSESELRRAIDEGATTISQLGKRTGVGTNCGSCLQTARSVLDGKLSELLQANPDLYYAA